MSTDTNEYLLPLYLNLRNVKRHLNDKSSCRFEFRTSDYPWIHISFIAVVNIPHNVLKCMGAIFAIGNSV